MTTFAMEKEQVLEILRRHAFPGKAGEAQLVETHISWVILAPDFVFKIKKPVRFDFLDFSTLALRKKFCREELRLNRRLAPDTYLGVLPVGKIDGEWCIALSMRSPADFAVWMRRENEAFQLDKRLRQASVEPAEFKALAHQLAVFHRKHALLRPHVEPSALAEDFADLFQHEKDLASLLGPSVPPTFARMREQLPLFLARHAERISARAKNGFWVDGHGDLHTRNIFLSEKPVIFDCLEFNPHLRRLDVLNELAFLAMDLDFFGRPDLSEALLRFYQEEHPCITEPEDQSLFLFFKAYRANVRLKVTLLAGNAASNPENRAAMEGYWRLLTGYWAALG